MSREEQALEKSIKKALGGADVAPKRKHVRACIVYTWDHKSAKTFFDLLKVQRYSTDELQLFKTLVLLHKVLQEGHPSALVEGIRNIDWIESMGRIFAVESGGGNSYSSSKFRYVGDEYGRLIGEYVYFLVRKLQFHKSHKGFNGTFEYEEYVSLVSVSDPNEGYATISDLMDLQDFADGLQKLIFASISSNRGGGGFLGFSNTLDSKTAVLVPLVTETYGIYKFVTSMLKALHKQMDDYDALSELFDRYSEQCTRLSEFYFDCNTVQALKNLITIPKLPSDPLSRILDDQDDAEVKDVVFERESGNSTPSVPSRSATQENLRKESPVRANSVAEVKSEAKNAGQTTSKLVPVATGIMVPTVTGVQPGTFQAVPAVNELWNTNVVAAPTGGVQTVNPVVSQPTNPLVMQPTNPLVMQPTNPLGIQQTNALVMQPTNPFQIQQQQQQQQEMQKELLIQQKTQSLQNDLVNLKQQYERDQIMLEQYDKRVQELESELEAQKEFKEKYQSLAKLYSQLRQEHLNVLKKVKKLQDDLNDSRNEVSDLKKEAKSKGKGIDRSGMILKSLVESSIKSLQDPIASLDVSDLATDLSNAFIDGDINTIVNILPEFVSLLLRCPQEMQTIAEDFLRCLSSAKQTDSVINANIAFQEKLKIRQYSYRYGDSDEV